MILDYNSEGCAMYNLFQKTSSNWVRYSESELRKADDGILYVTPKAKAKVSIYDPLKDAETMVIDALNVGMLCMSRAGEEKIQAAVMEFVNYKGRISEL